MLKIAKRLDIIRGNVLDYDNVIIFNNKYDSTWTYKKEKGYQPGVAFIGKVPVYIEGRSGKSGAIYRMQETLERSLKLLGQHKVNIKYFRSDAAAYKKSVVELMERKSLQYFIRAVKTPHLSDVITHDITDWKKVQIKGVSYEIGEGRFIPFEQGSPRKKAKTYRVVVTRVLIKGEYLHRSIMTNNERMAPEKVVAFYNQRGAIERNFDDLKNNFNWCRLPFSVLNENTTFLIISAIGNIVYQYLIEQFSGTVDFVRRNFRLKNFIFHFITVSSFWRRGKLTLFTQKSYEVLLE